MSELENLDLPSLNGNKLRGQWKMLSQPKNGFTADVMNGTGAAVTKNFGGKDYDFEFECGFNQKCTKIIFEVEDSLTLGTNAPIGTAEIARTWNHVACLFNQVTVEINNTQVDNISLLAELDSMVKKQKYTQAYFNGFGKISNLHSYKERKDESASRIKLSKIWICDACPMLSEESILQNSRVKITLKSDNNYATRAIASSSGVTEGTAATNWKYGVTALRMYYYLEDGDDAPVSKRVVVDYRPYYASLETLSGTGQQTKNFTVKPSTYEISLGLVSTTRNTATDYSPSVFTAANNPQNLTYYMIDYASQQFPNHTVKQLASTDELTGFTLSYLQSMFASDKMYNDAGGIDFDQYVGSPFFKHDILKRDDDKSTYCSVTLTPGGDSSASQLLLVHRYANGITFNYNNIGSLDNVSREF